MRLLFLTVVLLAVLQISTSVVHADTVHTIPVRAIDTMKISRDIAKDKLNDDSFDEKITAEVNRIANTGATHIAIDTPYDDEFLPLLRKWVDAARKANIKVWYRGNFSGWEGWFNYPDISRQEHQEKLKHFLLSNPDLFKDGDIFTACPECENGDPNPPFTGDPTDFRKFMIDEYNTMNAIFAQQHVHIITNYNSMNGALALRVMDKKTTQALGGVVGIDHYVKSPEQLVDDIHIIAKSSGGKVVIGEIGVPIPDINGTMTEQERAEWMAILFGKLYATNDVLAIDYWTSWGGSTALWDKEGNPSEIVPVITNFYKGKTKPILVIGKDDKPISNAKITTFDMAITENNNGIYDVPYLYPGQKILITADRYLNIERVLNDDYTDHAAQLKLDKNKIPWWEKWLDTIKSLFTGKDSKD